MLRITIFNQQQHRQLTIEKLPVQIVRCERPGIAYAADQIPITDTRLSPKQCLIDWADTDSRELIRVRNLGRSMVLHNGLRIHPSRDFELRLPAVFCAADTQIQLVDPLAACPFDGALQPLDSWVTPNKAQGIIACSGDAPSVDTLASWFEALGQLQHASSSNQQFFINAARAVFNPGGMDGAIILQRHDEGWKILGSHIPYPEYGFSFRESLVEQVAASGQSLFHDSSLLGTIDPDQSQHTCVVCPVANSSDLPDTVVYGFRNLDRPNTRRGIRPLEARFVQLVADTISAAMSRMRTEAEAARSQVFLEQAFSPQVARELVSNPEIIAGVEREVSVLFCDLRGFSTISERIGPRATHHFLTDVMDCFSEVIAQQEGVIIDYFGDGLSAFWNAPLDQPDHAERAVQTALEIQAAIPALDARWSSTLKHPLAVGVGVHAGIAQCGNSGSRRRLKYGPRGTAVNLASRIESATRHIGAPIIVSEATFHRVSDQFLGRRLCKARLKGLTQTVHLYQIFSVSDVAMASNCFRLYDQALEHFEQEELTKAIEILVQLQVEDDTDLVVEFLLQQAINRKQYHEQQTGAEMPLYFVKALTNHDPLDAPLDQPNSTRPRPSTNKPRA